MLFLLTVSNELIRKYQQRRMHWIIFFKVRNSLIHSKKPWSQDHRGISGAWVAHSDSALLTHGSFLVSAIPGIRGMLGWAQSVLDSSVSVDKGGEQVFICYVLWLRKWRALEFERLAQSHQNSAPHLVPGRTLPKAGCCLGCVTQCLGCFYLRDCLCRSGDVAHSGHTLSVFCLR